MILIIVMFSVLSHKIVYKKQYVISHINVITIKEKLTKKSSYKGSTLNKILPHVSKNFGFGIV